MSIQLTAKDKIFDIFLTEALYEDCEREIAMFKSNEEKHIFSAKFEQGIKGVEKRLNKEKSRIKLNKAAPKIATAAAVVIIFAALATNPIVSAFFKNIIVKIFGGANQYEFIDDVEITFENFNHELRPAYLPEGYKISRIDYSLISVTIEYISDDDGIIEITYVPANSGAIGVDNENSISRTVSVNGKEAVFHESTIDDRASYLIWNSGGYAFVTSAQIEFDEFVKIAESIKIS